METSNLDVAKTILQQLGGRRFMAMTGSTNFLAGPDSPSFKVGRNDSRVTHMRIVLTPADTYEMEAIRIRGTKRTTLHKSDNIYFDQLQPMFTKWTGMYTSL